MRLGSYVFEFDPQGMSIPQRRKTIARVDTYEGASTFKWDSILVGVQLTLTWDLIPTDQYDELSARYLTGGVYEFNPDIGSGYVSYNTAIRDFTADHERVILDDLDYRRNAKLVLWVVSAASTTTTTTTTTSSTTTTTTEPYTSTTTTSTTSTTSSTTTSSTTTSTTSTTSSTTTSTTTVFAAETTTTSSTTTTSTSTTTTSTTEVPTDEYYTDFSEYTTGVDLSDWTDTWGAGGFTFNAEVNAGTYKIGTKRVHFNSSSSVRKALTWDDVGSVTDSDIVVKLVTKSVVSSDGFRVYSRVSGSSGSENAYYLRVSPTAILIGDYVSGAASTIVSGLIELQVSREYWVRFRTRGTSLKARIWARDTVEPVDWTLEGTDSSLSTGECGIGAFTNTMDFYCDFFGVSLDGGNYSYPVPGFSLDEAFSLAPIDRSLQTRMQWARCMGGQFEEAGRELTGVGVYCTDHADDIRLAVYSGGSLATGPSGATLLHDFGKTSGTVVDDYVQLTTGSPVAVPQSAPLWLVAKGDNASGFEFPYYGEAGPHGNFQENTGRGDVTAIIGNDPDVAFPSTFPAGTTTFFSSWYDYKIYFDDYSGGTTPPP